MYWRRRRAIAIALPRANLFTHEREKNRSTTREKAKIFLLSSPTCATENRKQPSERDGGKATPDDDCDNRPTSFSPSPSPSPPSSSSPPSPSIEPKGSDRVVHARCCCWCVCCCCRVVSRSCRIACTLASSRSARGCLRLSRCHFVLVLVLVIVITPPSTTTASDPTATATAARRPFFPTPAHRETPPGSDRRGSAQRKPVHRGFPVDPRGDDDEGEEATDPLRTPFRGRDQPTDRPILFFRRVPREMLRFRCHDECWAFFDDPPLRVRLFGEPGGIKQSFKKRQLTQSS
mmetsp:Transcript_22316/g.53073  ORF Transcript_22316/g.53073 Transcript_22316/m.53073 type:complete len:290 (+) Transcript_22316:79-948(+)